MRDQIWKERRIELCYNGIDFDGPPSRAAEVIKIYGICHKRGYYFRKELMNYFRFTK